MDPEDKSVAWVTNLCKQFYTLCSEADAIIPQEPIEYVRNQFLTAGESVKQFYSELLEDTIAILKEGVPEEQGPTSSKHEENAVLTSRKMSNISIDDDEEGRSAVTSSSPSLPTDPDLSYMDKGNIGNLSLSEAKSAMEVEEYILPGDKVSSSYSSACSTEATHSCAKDFSALVCNGEAPKRDQNLDESLILVDTDEFCSDSVSFQKILKKKFPKKNSCETASRDIDAEKDSKEWERLDEEDLSDSDWEII